MKIYVCGDTHGRYDLEKLTSTRWPEGETLTKDDYLIILGDSGINWSNDPYETNDLTLKQWLEDCPWTTLDVLGNHHNYDRLFSQKPVPFYRGRAFHLSESIFALERGSIFDFNGLKIFSMGGGYSIDKNRRVDHVSWWEEEMPSYEEMNRGLKLLEEHGNTVDYIVSHTCSNITFNTFYGKRLWKLAYKNVEEEKALRDYFDYIENNITFEHWHFGHFHIDLKIDKKHSCHYNYAPVRIA